MICYIGTVPPRPCCCPGTSPPLAHKVAVRVTSRGVLAWCVVCGVHEAASVGVGVGQPSPSCLVVRPFVVALSTVWSFVCAGAAACAYSCSAHVRPGVAKLLSDIGKCYVRKREIAV